MTTESQRKDEENRGLRHACILACAAASLALFDAPRANAQAADPEGALADAVTNGRPILELRPRYNRIDESDTPERTEGVTYRAVAGWRSAPFEGLRVTIEGIHTDHIGPKHFNDDAAQFGRSEYPLLPDPRYTGFNSVHLEYAGIAATRVRLGQQVVRMDNGRWVSDNDFRQIPQLFDGVSIANTWLANTELYGARFDRLRDTSGHMQDLHLSLLHAAFNPLPGHALGAYAYYHDQPQNGAFTGFANNSYRVAGARAEGAFNAESLSFPYLVEAAQQRPYAGGDARVHGDYWRAGAGLSWKELTVRYDEESKGSNDGRYGVQMPLTDFYAFNGWTLHFFNTPAQGLRDRWLTLRWGWDRLVLYGEAHRFRSSFADLDFGRENDVSVSWSVNESATLRLQHAHYDPGSGMVAPTIRKTWLTLTYTY